MIFSLLEEFLENNEFLGSPVELLLFRLSGLWELEVRTPAETSSMLVPAPLQLKHEPSGGRLKFYNFSPGDLQP